MGTLQYVIVVEVALQEKNRKKVKDQENVHI
jgi:hypothetical protein